LILIRCFNRDSRGAHSSEHQCDATAVSVIRGHFYIFSLSQFGEFSTTRIFSCTFGGAQVPLFMVDVQMINIKQKDGESLID